MVHSNGHTRDCNGNSANIAPIVWANNMQPKSVSWLWRGWIPFGMLTMLDGDPGTGKSTLLIDILSRVTTGQFMPDSSEQVHPANVMILAGEDAREEVITPRLVVAGADRNRVAIVDLNGHYYPTFPSQLDPIRKRIEAAEIRLLVIDPLFAFLDDGIDSHKDASLRRVMAGLSQLAEETGTAIVLVRHFNKGQGTRAIHKGGGSVAGIAAVRSGLVVGPSPRQEGRYVLASAKLNVGKKPIALEYEIEGAEVNSLPASETTSAVRWHGQMHIKADDLVAPDPTGSGKTTELDKCVKWLRETLSDGPMLTTEVESQSVDAGFSRRTLVRARGVLGVVPERDESSRKFVLRLPGTVEQMEETAHMAHMAHMAQKEQRVTVPTVPTLPSVPSHPLCHVGSGE